MASSLTLKDLLAFAPADYTDSATAWAGWAKAAESSGDSLDAVNLKLKDNWVGSAAFAAQDKISTESINVKSSAATIRKIEASLKTGATTLSGYQSQAKTIVGEVQKDGFLSLDEGTCTVTAVAEPKNPPKNWGIVGGKTASARAASYQSQLRGILSKAQGVDGDIADEIDGMMPTTTSSTSPTGTNNGSGTPTTQGGSGGSGGGGGGNYAGGFSGGNGTPATSGQIKTYQDYASSQLSKYGWGQDQMTCLIKLWNQESGWNPTARNSSSGAFGIAQALGHGSGGGEYPSAAANSGNAQAQIDWGLNYIKGRYGSPCGAWSHETSYNWY